MKPTRWRIWIIFLLIVSVLVWAWTILVATRAESLLLAFNMAAPSSELYERTLKNVTELSTLLLLSVVIPMAIVNVLWLFAFLGERREVHRLKRHSTDPTSTPQTMASCPREEPA